MDRSRRGGAKQERPASAPPASSRLTIRGKRNRKRPVSLWSRMPNRSVVLDGCGRALRRSLPALAATAVLVAIGASLWLGYRFVTTSERFAIAKIEVQGATRLANVELPVKVGDNIFTTDLDDVTRALRGNPWIHSAKAHRVLPSTLVIEIRERTAVGVAQLGTELYLLDETGHPFKRAQTDELADLPIVTGIARDDFRDAPRETAELMLRALAVVDRWKANTQRPEISEIHIDNHHAITLHTYERGVAIQLGVMRELEARLSTFDVAWTELSDSERARVVALHLDARSDHVTIAFGKD